eukprot:393053-Prymnesium_polylepis.1
MEIETLHRLHNRFQLGIDACRVLIQTQVGTKFTASTSALSGHWLDENGKYYDANFEITEVASIKGNVARGFSSDDSTTLTTRRSYASSMLLIRRATVRKRCVVLCNINMFDEDERQLCLGWSF